MKPEVKNWFEKAKYDLKVAEYNLKGEMLDVAAFYSQQAAEKALKALHIARFGALWRVHDLVELARKLNAPPEVVELCAQVNPAYTATRYPDVGDIYEREEVEAILDGSRKVVKWIEGELSS